MSSPRRLRLFSACTATTTARLPSPPELQALVTAVVQRPARRDVVFIAHGFRNDAATPLSSTPAFSRRSAPI